MSQSGDKHILVGAQIGCTCAKCLAFHPARVLGKSPDLALPYDTARYIKDKPAQTYGGSLDDYQKQARHAVICGTDGPLVIFYEESNEIPADMWESAQDRPYQWWRATNEVQQVREHAKSSLELLACLAFATGLSLLIWAAIELAK